MNLKGTWNEPEMLLKGTAKLPKWIKKGHWTDMKWTKKGLRMDLNWRYENLKYIHRQKMCLKSGPNIMPKISTFCMIFEFQKSDYKKLIIFRFSLVTLEKFLQTVLVFVLKTESVCLFLLVKEFGIGDN